MSWQLHLLDIMNIEIWSNDLNGLSLNLLDLSISMYKKFKNFIERWRLVLLWISKDFSLNCFWLLETYLLYSFTCPNTILQNITRCIQSKKILSIMAKSFFSFGAKKGDILEKRKFSNTQCFQKFKTFWRSSITFCIKIHFSD